jgi:nucleoside-diphosphate-sugar epimerase
VSQSSASNDKPLSLDDWSKGIDPSIYIKKIDKSGEEVPGEIKPEELLIDYYRGRNYRDYFAEMLAAAAVRWTGDDNWGKAVTASAKKLKAFQPKETLFEFRELPFSQEDVTNIHFELKKTAESKLRAVTKAGKPQLQVLVTGGTGFIGMNLLGAVAEDDTVSKVYCVVWDQELKGLSVEEFKKNMMDNLAIRPELRSKYELLIGDVTKPRMNLSEKDLALLKTNITHVVHLAASVSFENPYDDMFRSNVTATQSVLQFAYELQEAPNSAFVNFISTETCYIHGRGVELCREDRLNFPRDYYNNHYELTKALADLYGRHFMLEKKLRCIQLCPAITVGDWKTGNNYGDSKVINAAANAFGKISEELDKQSPLVRFAVKRLLCFPGLREAKLNLVPADRVTQGLHKALTRPLATCERVHLGCEGIRIGQFIDSFADEIGIRVQMTNPAIHRAVRQPILKLMARMVGLANLYRKVETLFNIFGSYAEWGQPRHELGNDVRLLGLEEPRPDLVPLAHMLCRHNKQVQDWGRVRDKAVLMDRERRWKTLVDGLEKKYGTHAGAIPAAEFNKETANFS